MVNKGIREPHDLLKSAPCLFGMDRRSADHVANIIFRAPHVIDLIRHLSGEFEAVQAFTKTYITERPVKRGASEKGPVTVDDAAWLQIKLKNGAMGMLETSRFATGALDDLRIEICGEKGALRFDLMDGNWLYWFDASRKAGMFGGDRGWVRLETGQHFPGASIPTPPAGRIWPRVFRLPRRR